MARIKGAMMTRKRRNKMLGLAKGYWGNKHRHFKMAKEQLMKSGRYAYVGRKAKKRDFRKLWITRISAGCKINGLNYSTFMHGLKLAGVNMNRKMLSEVAIHDPAAFTALCEIAKNPAVMPKPEEKPAKAAKAPKAEKVEAPAEEAPAAEEKKPARKPRAKKAEAPAEEAPAAEEKKPARKPRAKKAEAPAE